MRDRVGAVLVLPLAWLLVTAAPAHAAAPRADSGHPSAPPSAPAADEQGGHVMPTPVQASPPAQEHSEHADHGDTPDHDAPAAEAERPLDVVLGVFGGVNGAVVLVAGALRRRDRSRRLARQELRSRRRRVPPRASATEIT